ncbi:MAG: hypothetical protein IT285_04745 [Bdellovibrionales bacterium]|nr:hypothetical protein [Bdellovibrionales bacterium]
MTKAADSASAGMAALCPSPVLVLSKEGSLIEANAPAAPILEACGIRPGAPIPRKWSERVEATLRRGRPRIYHVRPGDYEFQLTLVPWAERGAVVVFGVDVTVERTLESLRALRDRRAALQAQVRLFADLAAGWARRLGPPLAGASERAEELALRLERGESAQSLSALADELRSGLRALGAEVRALARIEPLSSAAPEPVDLRSVLADALALSRNRFAAAGVELKEPASDSTEETWVLARAGTLVTALFGLLTQALAQTQSRQAARWVRLEPLPRGFRICLPASEGPSEAFELAREAAQCHEGTFEVSQDLERGESRWELRLPPLPLSKSA